MSDRGQAALLWYELDDETSPDEDDDTWRSYWAGLESISQVAPVTNDPSNRTRVGISYGDLLPIIARVAIYLQNKLKNIDTKSDHLIVAVAIPEGPYQCIAVAVVHCFAVVLPMDPCAEGAERMQHMMDTVDLVLVASDQDKNRLVCLTDNANPRVWNVQDLMRSVLLEYDSEQTVASDQHMNNDQAQPALKKVIAAHVPQEYDRCFANPGPISHMVFTSGTSGGRPKLCVSSRNSLQEYIRSKNKAHGVTEKSVVLLASSLSFDPCFSDILATWTAGATLQIACRGCWFDGMEEVTHVLTTPSLWGTVPDDTPVPKLQVVALGGEQISRHIRQKWAKRSKVKLYTTYGVTEACVYQTIGKITENAAPSWVGKPFKGLGIRICEEKQQDLLVDVSGESHGEIVLFGTQLDDFSAYYQLPEMSTTKFTVEGTCVFYRTGDRGFLTNEGLHVLGRIAGEDNTVKFRGVRVDLKQMEDALLGGNPAVVDDAIVASVKAPGDTTSVADIVAYIALSNASRQEQTQDEWPVDGLLCSDPSLITLLQMKCANNARLAPTKFILLPSMPLTATGKRDQRALPSIDSARPMTCAANSKPLAQYGRCGSIVAAEISACLNFTAAQESLLSVASTFAMLGGDSLTSTRIVRAIYARHMKIRDCRHIGGASGTFSGPFSLKHFLQAENLGKYVDWLDRNGVCSSPDAPLRKQYDALSAPGTSEDHGYVALLHATACGYSSIAIALLRCGVKPNYGDHGGRIGKTNRLERKRDFRSNPLHLACLAGMDLLVDELLRNEADPKCPNASGMFPVHLAVGGSHPAGESMPMDEQKRRLHCIECLLENGSPLFMGDGNKQSVLHAAARSGNIIVLEFALKQWKLNLLEWRDQWSRTPVHWAVLNGRLDALKTLLSAGCSPCPQVFKAKQVRSSVALETPLEICERVHGGTELGMLLKSELLSAC